MVSTQSSNALLQNITTVFGSKASDNLMPFHAQASNSARIMGYETALHQMRTFCAKLFVEARGGGGNCVGCNLLLLAVPVSQAGRAIIAALT